MNGTLLFAYGTLLCGTLDPAVARLLRRATRRLDAATVRGRLHDQGGYPGLVPCRDGRGGRVHGQLLRLLDADRVLPVCDRYEGFDPVRPRAGEYRRVRLPVSYGGGEVEAWVYVLNRAVARPGRPLSGSDWRRLAPVGATLVAMRRR